MLGVKNYDQSRNMRHFEFNDNINLKIFSKIEYFMSTL